MSEPEGTQGDSWPKGDIIGLVTIIPVVALLVAFGRWVFLKMKGRQMDRVREDVEDGAAAVDVDTEAASKGRAEDQEDTPAMLSHDGEQRDNINQGPVTTSPSLRTLPPVIDDAVEQIESIQRTGATVGTLPAERPHRRTKPDGLSFGEEEFAIWSQDRYEMKIVEQPGRPLE